MKIIAMTYNIASGNSLARERDMRFSTSVIRKVRPDFVTLNEVRSHTRDVGEINQAWEAGRLTGYYPVFGKSIDIDGGDYGNAFLTRHPLLEQEVIHIPDRTSDEDTYFEHRSVLRCVLDIEGRPITVLSTHFGLAKVEAESAVETVLGIVGKEKNPVILMGDLNLRPDDEILQPLMKALHDTAQGRESIRTFPSDKPKIKIDYIFTSEQFEVKQVRSMNTQCSDHRPLIARLNLD